MTDMYHMKKLFDTFLNVPLPNNLHFLMFCKEDFFEICPRFDLADFVGIAKILEISFEICY